MTKKESSNKKKNKSSDKASKIAKRYLLIKSSIGKFIRFRRRSSLSSRQKFSLFNIKKKKLTTPGSSPSRKQKNQAKSQNPSSSSSGGYNGKTGQNNKGLAETNQPQQRKDDASTSTEKETDVELPITPPLRDRGRRLISPNRNPGENQVGTGERRLFLPRSVTVKEAENFASTN